MGRLLYLVSNVLFSSSSQYWVSCWSSIVLSTMFIAPSLWADIEWVPFETQPAMTSPRSGWVARIRGSPRITIHINEIWACYLGTKGHESCEAGFVFWLVVVSFMFLERIRNYFDAYPFHCPNTKNRPEIKKSKSCFEPPKGKKNFLKKIAKRV